MTAWRSLGLRIAPQRLARVDPLSVPATGIRRLFRKDEEDEARYLRAVKILRHGAPCAAFVLSVDPFLVSVYTVDLDAVIVLRFASELAALAELSTGACAVAGCFFDGRVASDVFPGHRATGAWGNAWPLLADLLTDDRDGLREERAAVPKAFYARAERLGHAWWKRNITPRDGRPSRVTEPANGRFSGSAELTLIGKVSQLAFELRESGHEVDAFEKAWAMDGTRLELLSVFRSLLVAIVPRSELDARRIHFTVAAIDQAFLNERI